MVQNFSRALDRVPFVQDAMIQKRSLEIAMNMTDDGVTSVKSSSRPNSGGTVRSVTRTVTGVGGGGGSGSDGEGGGMEETKEGGDEKYRLDKKVDNEARLRKIREKNLEAALSTISSQEQYHVPLMQSVVSAKENTVSKVELSWYL